MVMFHSPQEHRDFVVRPAMQVFDEEGIWMVVPQEDGKSFVDSAADRVQEFGKTVIFVDIERKTMVAR